MNVLFLSLIEFDSIDENNIYTDLLKEFRDNGHNIYVISPIEKRHASCTRLIKSSRVNILRVKIGNIQKTGFIEKGISTVLLEKQFINGIKKHFSDVKFDLVLYPTPPITLLGAVKYIKKRDNARTYLMLKDIFPQGAIDLGILKKSGIKGLAYRYFKAKEKALYKVSDTIGCMSQANVDYVINNNPEVNPRKIEICPNSIRICDKSISDKKRVEIRSKYGIPLNKKVFIYGGNLGKPQGIKFLIECLKSQENNKEVMFLIVGDGTEFNKLETYLNTHKPDNVMVMKRMPKEDYDTMVAACDVGMIFLDYRFTIPNFPSRLLSYMQAKVPVLAVTDINTDIGKIIVDGGFGWWCSSNDIEGFDSLIKKILGTNHTEVKKNEWEFLLENYDTKHSYEIIMNKR